MKKSAKLIPYILVLFSPFLFVALNIEEANIVAARRNGISKILIINALQAHQNNICFYKEENDIWLSDAIPPKFIRLINETH